MWLYQLKKSLRIRLAVLTQYRRVTDRQTDRQAGRYYFGLRQHKFLVHGTIGTCIRSVEGAISNYLQSINQGWHEHINESTIGLYITILSWYFQAKISWYFRYFRYFWYCQNINIYYYYLLTFLIHAHLTQTAQVPMLLDGAENIAENFNPLGRAQQHHRPQTDGSCHKANVT